MEKIIVVTAEELQRLIVSSLQRVLLGGPGVAAGHTTSCGSTESEDTTAIGGARCGATQKGKSCVEKRYFTVSEAAEYLNLAKQTIYGFTSSRTIPFIKRAKKLLFLREDLDRWLAEGKKMSRSQLVEAARATPLGKRK